MEVDFNHNKIWENNHITAPIINNFEIDRIFNELFTFMLMIVEDFDFWISK